MATQETKTYPFLQSEDPVIALGEIRAQKVDYEAKAKEAGDRAYRSAKADGASEALAQEFSKIFAALITHR